MLIPRFKVGQKVYAVGHSSDKKVVHRQCDICNSTGKVEINGKDFICPNCRGLTDIIHSRYKYTIDYYEAKIGKVTVEEYDPEYKECESRITYMLDKTGVGSGLIWNENRIFSTEYEAKNFCEKYMPSDEYDSETILRKK